MATYFWAKYSIGGALFFCKFVLKRGFLPWRVAADEGDDDAEKNEEEVQLSSPPSLRSKSEKDKKYKRFLG